MRHPPQINSQNLTLLTISIIVAAGITLYLAPSEAKYYSAHVVFFLIIFPTFTKYKNQHISLKRVIYWLTPIALVFLIPVFRYFYFEDETSIAYARDPALAVIPFMLLYFMTQALPRQHLVSFIVIVLMLPGLVHLAFMAIDVTRALLSHDSARLFVNHQGLFESFKDAPRVGRRYLSLALVQLLVSGALLRFSSESVGFRRAGLAISITAMLCLAFLDARSAYLSIVIGGSISVLAMWPMWRRVLARLGGSRKPWMAIGATLIAVSLVGYASGKSRWVTAFYSANLAIHDVFRTDVPLQQRPFVDQGVWDAEIDDLDRCFKEMRFRCVVDQSMYLRVAWLFTGVAGIIDHPLGVGYSPSYLGRQWGVEGVPGKFQRTDNFLIELGVSFGLLGIAFYIAHWWRIARNVRRALVTAEPPECILVSVLGCLLFICMGRSLIDTWSEGLWGYLFALFGIFAGVVDRQRAITARTTPH